MPCSDRAALLKATTQQGRLSTAVLCCGLEKNGMVGAWHGHGMASGNQIRPHCLNQMGKTHSISLSARNGKGTVLVAAWERHAVCVNRPFLIPPSNCWKFIPASEGNIQSTSQLRNCTIKPKETNQQTTHQLMRSFRSMQKQRMRKNQPVSNQFTEKIALIFENSLPSTRLVVTK
jgi:hypothetical protein